MKKPIASYCVRQKGGMWLLERLEPLQSLALFDTREKALKRAEVLLKFQQNNQMVCQNHRHITLLPSDERRLWRAKSNSPAKVL
jgi:hypothetical protein